MEKSKNNKQKVKEKIKKDVEEITGEMTVSHVLSRYPESHEIFLKYGMTCFLCSMSRQESIKQGCLAHGVDPKKVIEEINKKITKNKKQKYAEYNQKIE